MANSKPCKDCLAFIRECGIRRIYYSYSKGLVSEKSTEMKTEHICSKKVWLKSLKKE